MAVTVPGFNKDEIALISAMWVEHNDELPDYIVNRLKTQEEHEAVTSKN